MKRQNAYFLTSLFITYLLAIPILAQDKTEQVIPSDNSQITILYEKSLLNINCSVIPLNIILQSISDKTTTQFVLTDLAIDTAPKRLFRGDSYSNCFENNIETVKVSPSHAAIFFLCKLLQPSQSPLKKDISIRPATDIAAEERWYHAADFGFNNPFFHKVDSRRFWIWSVIRPDNNQLHTTFT